MGRNIIYKLLGALVILVAVVLWLLSIIVPDTFGFFNLAWAGLLLCGGLGLIVILQACFQPNATTMKKLKVWLGIGLLVCAVLCLVSALALDDSIVLPIIAIVIAVGIIITIFASAGKKWDEGDNHSIGYKNYHERKADEEKNNEQK